MLCPLDGRVKAVRIFWPRATWLAVQALVAGKIDFCCITPEVRYHSSATPSIATPHDLQPLLLPANFMRARSTPVPEMEAAWVDTACSSCHDAHGVHTVDDHRTPPRSARQDRHRFARIHADVRRGKPERRPRTTFDLSGPFFLYPAITYPHKGIICC